MTRTRFTFSSASVDIYTDASFSHLKKICSTSSTVLVTDENIFTAHKKKFSGWNTIVLKPGEEYKVQATADAIVSKLIDMGATRETMLVGVGGGVITDITGYVGAVFMRGIRVGFVPTTILAMVDAAIGGKNGVDVGIYKNLVGTIRQPAFLLYDFSFLNSLPTGEWESGFAEIIKHGCIRDAAMIRELEAASIKIYRKNKRKLATLIRRNMLIKTRIVQADEMEKEERKLLNFGHTLGHALENQYELSHGQAISIGMTFACKVSESLAGFHGTERIVSLLEKYNLPTYASFNRKKVLTSLLHDKKRVKKEVHFILLEKAGKGIIRPVNVNHLEKLLADF